MGVQNMPFSLTTLLFSTSIASGSEAAPESKQALRGLGYGSIYQGFWHDCTCRDLMNENGYGNCEQPDAAFSGSGVSFYVNEPSDCGDLQRSGTISDTQISAQACRQLPLCSDQDA